MYFLRKAQKKLQFLRRGGTLPSLAPSKVAHLNSSKVPCGQLPEPNNA